MSQVKEIPEADLDDFITIVANAYSSFQIASEEERQRLKQRLQMRNEDPTYHLYGLYREGKLLGGMALFDFTMNMLYTRISAGGVGLVAVDILHKKEKVAKDMISAFLAHYRERGATMTLLYPFRPDFYRKMGFCYGTKMNHYRLRPSDLPGGGDKRQVAFLGQDDKPLLLDCYNRYVDATHGMIEKSRFELNSIFNNLENRILGYMQDGKVTGYIVFTFKPAKLDNFNLNDIHVKEFIYTTREALAGLMAFLRSQSDQINRIFFNTQDEHFHFLPLDPRNDSENLIPHVYHESNTQGVGIMYRVVDTRGIFAALADHDFGGQTCTLKLTIDDSFFPANASSTIVHFDGGKAQIGEDGDYQAEVRLDIAEFSSLLMGAVPFKRLYDYGLADISDSRYVEVVNRIFLTEAKPVCTTPF